MIKDDLRRELLAMRGEDMRVRDELMASGELGGPYVPRMEEVHKRNASRLRELIELHGWPGEDIAEKDGCEAAWLIVQHSVGEPKFQRDALKMLQACAAEGRAPAWHAAYLEDRIALHEGRAQRYGTQWIDDSRDGRARPWTLADPDKVNAIRAEVGLGPLRPIPELGPELPAKEREEMEEDQRWWLQWLASKGWHSR
jgi:uncharacterized protein DUF6624